jgi:hypothetical protein
MRVRRSLTRKQNASRVDRNRLNFLSLSSDRCGLSSLLLSPVVVSLQKVRKSRPPERSGEGKAPGKGARGRGCREDCFPARTRALLARDSRGDGAQQRYRAAGGLGLAQKPLTAQGQRARWIASGSRVNFLFILKPLLLHDS